MLRLQHVWRTYPVGEQEIVALRDVSLEIRDGDFMAIVGPSGSGKSTLLQIVGLLDRPTARHASQLDGHDLDDLDDAARTRLRLTTLGFVFQRFHLLNDLTAIENVAIPMEVLGLPGPRALRAGGLAAQGGRARRAARLQAVTPLGRTAPARRHCPSARQRPAHHPRRRADRRAPHRGQGAGDRALSTAQQRGLRHRHGDARSGGGSGGEAPHRDQRRPGARGRRRSADAAAGRGQSRREIEPPRPPSESPTGDGAGRVLAPPPAGPQAADAGRAGWRSRCCSVAACWARGGCLVGSA